MCFRLPRSFSLGAETSHPANLESAKGGGCSCWGYWDPACQSSTGHAQAESSHHLQDCWPVPGIKVRRAACRADLEEPAQKCWSLLLAQPDPRRIGGSDLAAGPDWDQLWGKRPQEALGVVPLSFPLSSGDLRRQPCLLKAF